MNYRHLGACLATASVLAVPASADSHPTHPSIVPLNLTLTAGRTVTACTKPIPDAWGVAVWVSVNGQDVQSTGDHSSVLYFAGNGTMVKMRSYRGNGPTCARAITWLPTAKVHVHFRVL